MTANPHASPSFTLSDGRQVQIVKCDGFNWTVEIQIDLGKERMAERTRMEAMNDLPDSTFAEIEAYCLAHDEFNRGQELIASREIAAGRHA